MLDGVVGTTFKQDVQELLALPGWTLQRIAKSLGYAQYQTVAKWRDGDTEPDERVQRRLRQLLANQRRLQPEAADEGALLRREIVGFSNLLGMDELREIHAMMADAVAQRFANGEFTGGGIAVGVIGRPGDNQAGSTPGGAGQNGQQSD